MLASQLGSLQPSGKEGAPLRRGKLWCGGHAAVAEVGWRLGGAAHSLSPESAPGTPTPRRLSVPVSSPELRRPESQHLGGEAVQAPLDGRAPAKLLQDSPDVVQVAGSSQPHSECDALWGRVAGVTDVGW